MKTMLTVLALFILTTFATSQVTVSTAYNYNSADSFQTALGSIRGVGYDADLMGDGVSAIAATNYNLGGVVHVFAAVGNDSIELKWTSPVPPPPAGGSTPRYVAFGDLDNDGLKEVIYQSNENGFLIYEWDGVPGSWNFGTTPSQIIDGTYFPAVSGYTEEFEILDIDGDGTNELITSMNPASSANDGFFVVSAVGEWSTDDPGFSGFTVEFQALRPDYGDYGLGGSPMGMFSAQLDGVGNREAIMHNWNFKNVTVLRATGADTYEMADNTNGKQNYFLTGEDDDVALFGGIACDVNGDGREEAFLPTYNQSGNHVGEIHMIHYADGQSVSEIDSTNVTVIDASEFFTSSSFGYGFGDIDKDGNVNVYTSGAYGTNVVSLEFQGGDLTDSTNWLVEVLYAGEPTILDAITYKDSLGVLDTIKTVNTGFVSKLYGQYTDFDKDGLEDIILPYQSVGDSITVTNSVWNEDSVKFIDTSYKIVNPKRWSLRIIEGTKSTALEGKDVTVITPDDYKLNQNYPNPFNPTTNIEFYLPIKKNITLTIYNAMGQKVKTLVNGLMGKGNHTVQWDATNESGVKVATGMYIYELRFGNFKQSKRMMLVK
ncbi:MAG: T9SS type A sorting domain-containing protein [Calditrichae bacterium]|nr:T9SS type A sorting domain-containing protein [Calditrichia bacterium]